MAKDAGYGDGHRPGGKIENPAQALFESREALRRSEEQLRLATEHAEIGLWDVDEVNKRLFWPPRVKAMFGISTDVDVSMEDYYAGLHPDDFEATAAAYAAAADPRRRALYDVEYRTIGKEDGVVRWVAAKGRGVFDDEGRCLRVIGTAIDITSRKVVAERLAASEARLRLLDEIGRETARLLDAGEILSVTTRLVGTAMGASVCAYADMDGDEDGFTIRGDWAAPGSSSIVGHYSLAAFGKMAVRNLKAGEPLVVNDNLRELAPEEAATFQSIGIGSTICMPLVKDGRLTALMAVHHKGSHAWTVDELDLVREVTERSWAHVERAGAAAELKSTADQLATLNADLEERVRQRTAELMAAEETLRQSQKMEVVGQLTGGLAHDFNNLLAGIQGSLETIEARIREGRSSEVDRYLTGALASTKRAASITQRLLAFSRRQTLAPKPTDPLRLVSGMMDLIRGTIGPAIEVTVAADGEPWPVLVDPNQLENALLNLCINARDAMRDGGRIVIEIANEAPSTSEAGAGGVASGECVCIRVCDSGAGMPPDVLEKAFDPFFTTKPIGVGTGLGLSMIYGFVRQSGGEVGIRSEVGQGTTVSLHLPRHEVAEAAAPVASVPLPLGKAKGGSVLVVDDEPLVRMLMVDCVEDLGLRATEAEDGAEALEVLRSDTAVDLLVTDVGLPRGMNGRQLAEAARELRPSLPIVFVTGYAETSVLEGIRLQNNIDLVSKPFAMPDLKGRILSLIGG
ncbi:ATP-binding protein [Aureimonas sp. SK2]|uniref:ATP-binding protein n=1 Tax=Aureimonas sp. SK2 TaxID=3015992 RepID=UPI00387ED192